MAFGNIGKRVNRHLKDDFKPYREFLLLLEEVLRDKSQDGEKIYWIRNKYGRC